MMSQLIRPRTFSQMYPERKTFLAATVHDLSLYFVVVKLFMVTLSFLAIFFFFFNFRLFVSRFSGICLERTNNFRHY